MIPDKTYDMWTDEDYENAIPEETRRAFDRAANSPEVQELVNKMCSEKNEKDKELSMSLQIQAYLTTASDELYAIGKPLHSEDKLKEIHQCMLMWQKLHNHYFKDILQK